MVHVVRDLEDLSQLCSTQYAGTPLEEEWRFLCAVAIEVLLLKLEQNFGGTTVNDEAYLIEAENILYAFRREMFERQCYLQGVEPPDLSLKAFRDWLLRY